MPLGRRGGSRKDLATFLGCPAAFLMCTRPPLWSVLAPVLAEDPPWKTRGRWEQTDLPTPLGLGLHMHISWLPRTCRGHFETTR